MDKESEQDLSPCEKELLEVLRKYNPMIGLNSMISFSVCACKMVGLKKDDFIDLMEKCWDYN